MNTEKLNNTVPPQLIYRFFAATVFWILALCLFPGPAPAGTPSSELDDDALKAGIVLRLQTAWGVKDDRFQQITPAHVTIIKQIPVQAGPLTVFAVKLRITPPVSDLPPEFITLVADETGTLQFGGIQDLATGINLVKEAVDQLQEVDIADLPVQFGKTIHTGTGPHAVIMISDPFCPHCRRGWEFIRLNLDRIHTLRLAHFPLNQAAETAALVMADAYHREIDVFDIIDFTYTLLDPSQDPLDILAQYMDEFPVMAEKWGPTPEGALSHLREHFLTAIKAEQHTVRTLGIHSTPVFFVNQTFIKGFNTQKMEAAMP